MEDARKITYGKPELIDYAFYGEVVAGASSHEPGGAVDTTCPVSGLDEA